MLPFRVQRGNEASTCLISFAVGGYARQQVWRGAVCPPVGSELRRNSVQHHLLLSSALSFFPLQSCALPVSFCTLCAQSVVAARLARPCAVTLVAVVSVPVLPSSTLDVALVALFLANGRSRPFLASCLLARCETCSYSFPSLLS